MNSNDAAQHFYDTNPLGNGRYEMTCKSCDRKVFVIMKPFKLTVETPGDDSAVHTMTLNVGRLLAEALGS